MPLSGCSIVLNALLDGHHVPLTIPTSNGPVEYLFTWQDDQLWIVGTHYPPGQWGTAEVAQEILLSVHDAITLEVFVRAANAMPEERLIGLAASTVLTAWNRDRWAHR